MSGLKQKVLAGSILVGLVAVAPLGPAAAQKAVPPDFSSNNTG
jgi:hypothetical protein